jgi:predicted Zn finger-like uncharacterized protein
VAIVINCQQCEARFSVKDALSGKRIRCVKCQGVIAVPEANGLESHNSIDKADGKVPSVNRAPGGQILTAPVGDPPESSGPKAFETTDVSASLRPGSLPRQ